MRPKCENAGWCPVPLHYSDWAFCQKANLQLLHEGFGTGQPEIARQRLSFLLRRAFKRSPTQLLPSAYQP